MRIGIYLTSIFSLGYESDHDQNLPSVDTGIRKELKNPIFAKGQSKRIWNELYKVIDSSDVIIHGMYCFSDV